MVSTTRLYGAAIAVVSGVYSLWSATSTGELGTAGWAMGLLGVVVVVHGVVLLTPSADRLGDASGPLMVAYALAMLLVQVLLAAGLLGSGGPMDGAMGGMDGGMGGMGEPAMTAGMGWDAGMVALAGLMLVSGVIMTRDGGMATADGGM